MPIISKCRELATSGLNSRLRNAQRRMIGFTLLVCLSISSSFLEQSSPSTEIPVMSKVLAVDFEVFGIVQGVFFRKVGKPALETNNLIAICWQSTTRKTYAGEQLLLATSIEHPACNRAIIFYIDMDYTQKRGKELGLTGWCMNTSNGTVVGYLEGKRSQIEEMKQWLRHTGSPQSRIDKAEFRNEKEISQPSFSNFEIRR